MSTKSYLAAVGLGTGLMYFLDPDRGKRRRAVVRDRAAKLARQTSRIADKTMRDVANRTHGLAAETESLFNPEPVPDEVLEARIHTRIGRLVAHPREIQVSVSGGKVTLEGTAAPAELARVAAAIRIMRGVNGIDNRLHPYGSLANGSSPIPETWKPTARIAAGVAGSVAAAAGLWLFENRGVLAAMLTMSGTGLLARSVTNQRLTKLAGLANHS